MTHLGDGTPFSPQFVENKLKYSPYVREAVVFGGEGKAFVSALVVIDFQNVGSWAEKRQIPFTTFTDLSQQDAVRSLLTVEVELPRPMQVRRFLLLHKELDADDAELTRTRKVRRHTVSDRYRDLVNALYGENETVSVTTEITYQDGRRARLALDIPIVTLA